MFFLEMRTLVILTMLANFVFAAIMLAIRHMAPGEESLRRWVQGAIASGLGNLLITLRGVVPDLASIILANVLFAWGYANLYLGSRYFFGKPPGPSLEWILGGLTLLLFIPFTYVYPNLEVRIVVISLVLGYCGLLHARLMLTAQDEYLRGATRFVGWMLLATGCVITLRGLFTPFAGLTANLLGASDWIKASPFVVSLVMSMCLGAAFPIMVIARMQHALAERSAELEQANRELQLIARCDPLTGLHNRRATIERLEIEWAKLHRTGHGYAVVLFDLDHFKQINDQYGHEMGDAALRQIADVLRERIRAGDHVGRHGGEEFILVLPDTDLEGACTLANNIRQHIADLPIAGIGQITVSGGVTTVEPSDAGIDPAIARADHALYAAKHAGRNRICPAPKSVG